MRVLVRVVDGVQAADFSSFVVTIAVLTAVALTASFIPARQASRVDALQALRQE
jgi:ABC-type lipoprotein release transport system permease subunit